MHYLVMNKFLVAFQSYSINTLVLGTLLLLKNVSIFFSIYSLLYILYCLFCTFINQYKLRTDDKIAEENK